MEWLSAKVRQVERDYDDESAIGRMGLMMQMSVVSLSSLRSRPSPVDERIAEQRSALA